MKKEQHISLNNCKYFLELHISSASEQDKWIMTTAIVDFTFPLAKLAQTESGEGGGGGFTGLSRLFLKHRVGRGPVHLLNVYWPVPCCS